LTFVIVGGGFNGIKNVGELNHFVKDVIKDTYYNLDSSKN
jgi:NADH dehydrogenase FAD-containing subunit